MSFFWNFVDLPHDLDGLLSRLKLWRDAMTVAFAAMRNASEVS